jgi:hypothetical protein
MVVRLDEATQTQKVEARPMRHQKTTIGADGGVRGLCDPPTRSDTQALPANSLKLRPSLSLRVLGGRRVTIHLIAEKLEKARPLVLGQNDQFWCGQSTQPVAIAAPEE